MNLTEERLRNIIRGELLHPTIFEALVGKTSISIDYKSAPVHLFEHRLNRPSRSITFDELMRRKSKGIISERKAYRLWERSVSYELDNLLEEGIGDALKKAYASAKGGAIKIKDKLSSATRAALEKVNDFILKISLQAMNMAERSVEGIVKGARALSGAVERFRDNHPILYKIIKILVIMLIIWGIMSLFSGEAQASVKLPSGNKMTEAQYNTLRGALGEYGGGDVDKIMQSGNDIKILDKAYKAKEAIPVDKLGAMNKAGLDTIAKLVGEAKGGDEVAYKLLMKWQKIGQNLTVR